MLQTQKVHYNTLVNISNTDLSESQINKLKESKRRKHPSPQIQIYDKLKRSIQQDIKQTFSVKNTLHIKQLHDYKSQKDLENLVTLVIKPCLHLEECIHYQLHDKNLQGKTFRQICEFRLDWNKRIQKIERNFEKFIINRKTKLQQLNCVNNDELQFFIQYNSLLHHNQQNLQLYQYINQHPKLEEFVKKLPQKHKIESTNLLSQFEDIQHRKKYIQAPSIWSIFDCSCNTTFI